MSKLHPLRLASSLWLMTLIGLLLATLPVHAAGPTQVRVTPSDLQIAPGETAQVVVEVADVQGLYGVDVTLTFDPNAVQVAGAVPNQQPVLVAPGTFLDAGFVAVNQVDNAAGTVHFIMTQVNPSQPKNGGGTLIVVNLKGKTAGTASTLRLTRADLATADAAWIPASLVPGQVRVVSTLPGSPTATVNPTQAGATAQPPTVAPTAAPHGPISAVTAILTPVPTALPAGTLPQAATPPAVAPTTLSPTPLATTTPPTVMAQSVNPASAAKLLAPVAIATRGSRQLAAGATIIPTAASPTPARGVTETAAAIAGTGPTPIDLPAALGAASQADSGAGLAPVVVQLIIHGPTPAAIVAEATPAATGRALSNPMVQTVLVFGGFGVGLVVFVALIAAFFIRLQPRPGAPGTKRSQSG